MPGLVDLDLSDPNSVAKPQEYGFMVSHQLLEFEVDFPTQTLKGHAEITILPQTRDLYTIRIDAGQCVIPQGAIRVNDIAVKKHEYVDRMLALNIPDHLIWNAESFAYQQERLQPLTEDHKADGGLSIPVPRHVQLQEVDPLSDSAAGPLVSRALNASAARQSSVVLDTSGTPVMTPRTAAEQSSRFQPLTISIPFTTKKFRDGLHFVGLHPGDTQFPHVYSKHSMDPGTASCIFPCIDDPAMRCTWEIKIKCARTLADALKRQPTVGHSGKKGHVNGLGNGTVQEEDQYSLSDDEKLLEMAVVCSGEQTLEEDDPNDSSKKIVSFICSNIVAAQHIGFAIGPFEQVDLTEYREDEDGEKIGQGQSLPVFAYCLPGRSHEVRHVCLPMAHTVDWFMLTFGSYPFSDFSFVFVDGQAQDVEHTASLSICSDRLLFPPDIIDPEMETIRTLVHAIASQWIGVSMVANQKVDRWLVVGLSHFMADRFMLSLCGTNDYMFRKKQASDKLVALDVTRPSISALGEILHLGQFEMDFMKLKAPLVLFILDKRLYKATSTVGGLVRVISKLITQANIGTAADSVLSTEGFRRLTEKVTKWRQTESFWNQWILGAGCPKFTVTHKFNKKKLHVEITISQTQQIPAVDKKLEKGSFFREVKEDIKGVYAGELQPIFTGSMTVRIHEADGTPYEHVLEITKASETFSIPYNTKYKRLKRNNRQRERMNAGAGNVDGEVTEDTLLFCLGDILSSEEEKRDWELRDWDDDNKMKMETEHFEWYRVDADFEWLCEKDVRMPSYMYVSQLQQDKDVVAHQETMLFLQSREAHPLVATFLIRTVMDSRYYYGIRTMAVACLKNHAVEATHWLGLKQLEKACAEFFCYPGSMMPRTNDFSDRRAYFLELSIPHSVSNIRDRKGNCPQRAREFILDQIRFNDNTNNDFSDFFKIANLLKALANSLIPTKGEENVLRDDDNGHENQEPALFRAKALEELDRHRRMDEWLDSYQNILTTTVLEAKMKLMKAKVIPVDKTEFLKYLIDGNLEQVRITAFKALVEVGLMNEGPILKFLLCCLSSDPSPYVRTHLFEVFMLGLARIALEDIKPVQPVPVRNEIDDGGLQIEEDFNFNVEEQKALVFRTTTIEGALAALKGELQDNEVLKTALWDAIKSDTITLKEQVDLLDICYILYDSDWSITVKLPLPRYWKVSNLGKGHLKFQKTDKVRTKPRIKPKMVKLPPKPIQQPAANFTMANIPSITPAPAMSKITAPIRISLPTQPPVIATPPASASTPIAPHRPLKLVLGPAPRAPTVPTPAPPPTIAVAKPPAATKTPAIAKPPTVALGTPMDPPPLKRPAPSSSVEFKQPRKIVKLSISGARLDAILKSTPNPNPALISASAKKKKPSPTPAKASSLPRQSPSPAQSKPSPSPSAQAAPRPSPSAFTSSASPSVGQPPTPIPNTASPGVVKIRKPLPDAAPRPSTTPQPLPPTKPTMKIKLNTKPKVALNGSSPPPPTPQL